MIGFIGKAICKLDSKNRILLPSKFTRQMSTTDKCLIANRGFDKCVVLCTETEWEAEQDKIKNLNVYEKEQRILIRQFFEFAEQLTFDSNGRLMLPTSLVKFADLKKEVLLLGQLGQRIEIWEPEIYDLMMGGSSAGFEELAKKHFSPGRRSDH